MEGQDCPWKNHLIMGKLVRDLEAEHKVIALDVSHVP